MGESGSGKSTLARLVLRQYEATEGCVALDGVDVRDVSQKESKARRVAPRFLEELNCWIRREREREREWSHCRPEEHPHETRLQTVPRRTSLTTPSTKSESETLFSLCSSSQHMLILPAFRLACRVAYVEQEPKRNF